jgi:hypothetical protein
LSPDILSQESGYLGNTVDCIPTLLSIQDLVQKPLGYTASQIRQSITELHTRNQSEAYAALFRENFVKCPPCFGDWSSHIITFTNWSKYKFFDADLSASIKGGDSFHSIPAKPSWIQNWEGISVPNGFIVYGKDTRDNYWMSGTMSSRSWDKVDELLKGQNG